jgi:hypothetical protein
MTTTAPFLQQHQLLGSFSDLAAATNAKDLIVDKGAPFFNLRRLDVVLQH